MATLRDLVSSVYARRIAEAKAALVPRGPSKERCAICLEVLRGDVASPPGCTHCFHRKCLSSWIHSLRVPDRIQTMTYADLEHPELSDRSLSCPVCGRPLLESSRSDRSASLSTSLAALDAASLRTSLFGPTMAQSLVEQDAAQDRRRVAATRTTTAFPATLPRASVVRDVPAPPDWQRAIAATRHLDAERRSRIAADAAEAADVARAARMSLCERFAPPEVVVSVDRLALVDEIVRVGSPTRVRALYDDARAVYPPELIAWARRDPKTVKRVEEIFEEVLSDSSQAASRALPPQTSRDRKLSHLLSEIWGLRSASFDAPPNRHVRVDKIQTTSRRPSQLTLSQVADFPDEKPHAIFSQRRSRRRTSSRRSRPPFAPPPPSPPTLQRNQDMSVPVVEEREDPVLREAIRRSLLDGDDQWKPTKPHKGRNRRKVQNF